MEQDGRVRHFNTSILVGRVGTYRKVHLPGHREPQNYGLIGRPEDASEAGDDARANPKRGSKSGENRQPLLLAVFFSLVVALQRPQQRPRQNDRQDEGHEYAKGNDYHAHEILAISPTNPNNRTTAPIAPATMATYFS